MPSDTVRRVAMPGGVVMAKRQKKWAKQQRTILHWLLGNKCCDCGTTENLQLDCDVPQGKEHHRKMAWDCRMRFYWRQYHASNLRLRCAKHNGLKGGTADREYWQRVCEEQEAKKLEEQRMLENMMVEV
jgi:hypothetical protein